MTGSRPSELNPNNYETIEEAIARFENDNDEGRVVIRDGKEKKPIEITFESLPGEYAVVLGLKRVSFKSNTGDLSGGVQLFAESSPKTASKYRRGSLCYSEIERRHKTSPRILAPKRNYFVTGIKIR